MINSRNIDDLRADVAVNCRKLIELAKARGLPVLVTATYRDAEYQKWCYLNGTSATPEVGPHGYGLAFDICKNVKGHEYDDLNFFREVASVGKAIGFDWGGDWKSFVDRPHFEWLGNPPVNRNSIVKGAYVSRMPEYGKNPSYPEWAQEAIEWAVSEGITDGTNPNDAVTLARLVTILYRYNKKRSE